jgi:hypothetical protein
MKRIIKQLLFIITALVVPMNILSQESQSSADSIRAKAVKIFLDCNDCDMNYTRQEIPYINYVRDVREAEVFILVTQQDAGGGGEQFTFTSRTREIKGINDTLTYSSPHQTSTIIREKRTNIKNGTNEICGKDALFDEIEINHNEDLESRKSSTNGTTGFSKYQRNLSTNLKKQISSWN